MAKAPGTPPARGQRPRCQPAFAVLVMTPPSRHSISGFGSTSVLLTWWARWVRITPLHGGVSSPGAQSFAQEAARAHAWAGTDSASPPALEACLRRAGSQPLPGVKLPPGASGSFSAKVEAHASIGTGTERCLSPAAAGEQPWEAAGRPTLAGRGGSSPLFWVGCGCLRVGNGANTHKLSLVSTNVTASLPRSPTQTRGS